MKLASTLGLSLLSLLMAGSALIAKAQLVFIPDVSMRAWLNMTVPGVVDGNGYMDTADPGIGTLTTVDLLVDWSPADLTGLEYLTGAQTLSLDLRADNCVFPAFPPGARSLTIQGPYNVALGLTTLPAFPAVAEWVTIGGFNGMAALPSLPLGVGELEIHNMPVLSTLPSLPVGLTHLAVQSNMDALTTLPALPATLESLRLNGVPVLTQIPALPNGMDWIELRRAPALTELPPLPNSIYSLYIHDCGLLSLPALPADLYELTLDQLSILEIPALPPGLDILSVSNLGQITTIPMPTGPIGSIVLSSLPLLSGLPPLPVISYGLELSDLPSMPSTPVWPDSVEQLMLNLPHLDTILNWPEWSRYVALYDMPLVNDLPPLSMGRTGLALWGMTGLTVLPELVDHISALEIEGCPLITCVPLLPDTMEYAFFNSPGLNCIPNSVYFTSGLQYPLCSMYNSTCPILNPVISGSVYFDENENGMRDPGEMPLPLATVTIEPIGITTGVDSNGVFSIAVPIGAYTISATYPNLYVTGVSPIEHTATLVGMTELDEMNDFGITIQPNVQDLALSVFPSFPRPGFNSMIPITYVNNGTVTTNAEVTLNYDPLLNFDSSDPAPTSITGQTVTWDIPNVEVGATGLIRAYLYTDPTTALGLTVQHEVTLGPLGSDATPADNLFTVIDTVIGGFDPNDKQVLPDRMTPAELAMGDPLEYRIRFQNTGTYLAERVIVSDTLSEELQWNTFQFRASSHTCTWSLHNGVLEVVFNEINLPDSASDQLGSNGFVSFSIKPNTSLLLGETVSNVANIYFDFNEPIITNDAAFVVDEQTSIAERNATHMTIFPNPVEDWLTLQVGPEHILSVEVIDAVGRSVLMERGSSRLRTSSLKPGTYTLRVNTDEGCYVRSVVKL